MTTCRNTAGAAVCRAEYQLHRHDCDDGAAIEWGFEQINGNIQIAAITARARMKGLEELPSMQVLNGLYDWSNPLKVEPARLMALCR